MSSTHILILAITCILAGALLTAIDDGSTTGIMLVTAGVGVVTWAMHQQKQETKAVVKRCEDKAQEALEETQTLRRDILRKPD